MMTIEKILVVDDESVFRMLLHDLLVEESYTVTAVASLSQAREAIRAEGYDLVLCDVQLEDGNGLDFITELRDAGNEQKVVIMTGFASMDLAVKAIRVGALDFLIKPIEPDLLHAVLSRLSEQLRIEEENRYHRQEAAAGDKDWMVWGESPAMAEVKRLVEKVGPTDTTVLIQGESGTGKEMISRSLHLASRRSGQAMIKVNCAAVPATLLESEFFGHEKGAFTGAVQRRQGRFELADGGTILLDEITEIPLELQVKLLRVLQEREFERLGGTKTLKVDVRLIATTNRQIEQEVKKGTFREDLYYRLNVFPIILPPVRERGSDVLKIAREFLSRFARRHGKPLRDFSGDGSAALLNYPWPGNVRELQNTLERAVIMAGLQDTLLTSAHLSLPTVRRDSAVPTAPGPIASLRTIAEMEREMIELALKQCNGNRTHAAKVLGISLRTLRNRLAEYRMDDKG